MPAFKLIARCKRDEGPRIDDAEMLDVLIDELPDEIWLDDTRISVIWETE